MSYQVERMAHNPDDNIAMCTSDQKVSLLFP